MPRNTLKPVIPDLSPPSILQQTEWEAGFYEFPKRYKVQYFNPGLVDWQGQRWLITRRRRCAPATPCNDLTAWRLTPQNTLLSEHPIKIPFTRHDEHWEDPRAINVDGQLWVSYSNFYTRGFWVHQGIARVNSYLQANAVCHPVYGENNETIYTNTGHEKNWIWFAPQDLDANEGKLLMIYAADPHTVVRFNPGKSPTVWETRGIRWSKGLIRGGTPPVYVPTDNLYWSFFHSSVDLGPNPPKRRYYIGAYAFEPQAPFRIQRRTSIPLLAGSDKDPREPHAPLCVFPCGAILDGQTWHLTMGVNDCACAWIKIPHQALWDKSFKLR